MENFVELEATLISRMLKNEQLKEDLKKLPYWTLWGMRMNLKSLNLQHKIQQVNEIRSPYAQQHDYITGMIR